MSILSLVPFSVDNRPYETRFMQVNITGMPTRGHVDFTRYTFSADTRVCPGPDDSIKTHTEQRDPRLLRSVQGRSSKKK